jgi:hypothetical protein
MTTLEKDHFARDLAKTLRIDYDELVENRLLQIMSPDEVSAAAKAGVQSSFTLTVIGHLAIGTCFSARSATIVLASSNTPAAIPSTFVIPVAIIRRNSCRGYET